MRLGNFFLVVVVIVTACVSCKMIDTFTGGNKPATVDALWPDVPPFPDATKTDLELPLGARLMIRAAMQGKVSFIAFNTGKSESEVQSFYTKDRMKSAGWTANEQGCVADTEDKKSQGAVCFFNREEGKKKEGLAIIMGQDEKTKLTQIFYARIDLTEPEKTPTP